MAIYQLDGHTPELPPDGRFWIAPDAHLIGQVRLGTGVSIWFGAVLRGDNGLIDVEAGSNIQDGAVLHTDPGFPLVIERGVTVGHRAILHGCRIGAGTLVGMGATILNGARIGAECLVGANALVTEGKSFPDRSLIVGAPAKAVRTLSADAIAGLRASAAHYEANGDRYRARLVRVG